MKTSEIFKGAYGVTLGYLCAKVTVKVGCNIFTKLCDAGIKILDKVDEKLDVPEKKYSLMEGIDDNCIQVECATAKDLKDLIKWFDLQLLNYGCLSVNDLKEYIESGFTSFEYKDQAEGWASKAYHIDRVTNTVIFDMPIDISDLVFDPDKDIEEEGKEDDVEASE